MNLQKFKEQYQKFIIQNRNLVLKTCYHNSEYTELRKIHANISQKWDVVIDRFTGFLFGDVQSSNSDKFKEIMTLYLESVMLFINSHNNSPSVFYETIEEFSFGDIIQELNKQITSKSRKRSKIIERYFNYSTSEFELLLENGDYISEISKRITHQENPTEIDLTIFPEGFLLLLDKSDLRNLKIDKII